jgi:adenosylhomocysteine nucleosidase
VRLAAFLTLAIGAGLVTNASAQERARVVVLISANAEWGPTKAILKPTRVERTPYGELFTHVVAGEPIVFLHGGWGKTAAAASTEYAISRWRPDLLINLGTCGGVSGRVERFQRLLVTRTVIHDIQEAMGDSAEAIRAYSTEIDLDWIDDAFPLAARRALMLSGDRDLVPALLPPLLARYPDMVAADWESGAIAHVARLRQTRLLIVRMVSDLVSPTQGEAQGNLPVFENNAARSMGILLDDLPSLVPYLLRRLVRPAAGDRG